MLRTFNFCISLFSVFLYVNKYKDITRFNWLNLIVLFAIFLVIYLIIEFGFAFIMSLFVDKKKSVKKPNKFFVYLFIIFNEFICSKARIKVKVKNKEKLDKTKKYIIVCNHRSKFDPMIIANEFKEMPIAFISKPENLNIPLAGNIVYECGYKGIDRNNDRKALVTIKEVSEIINNNHISYGVFPEGTRNKSNAQLLDFKNGCLKLSQKTGCPILVLTLKNTEKIAKNFPFKSTSITLDIVDVIDSSIFNEKNTIEVGNIIKEKMLNSLENENT